MTLTESLAASTARHRILLVTPSPLNDPERLDPRHELEEIYRALDELRVDVEIVALNPPTVGMLRMALAAGGFDVVHIAMHATGEHLEFEAENGLLVRLSYERFARLFRQCPDLLLVLNGCATEELADCIARSAAEVTAISVAGDVPRAHARAVLADVYRMLFSGVSPERAVTEASAEASGLSPEGRPLLRVRGKAAGGAVFDVERGRAVPKFSPCAPHNSFPAVHNRFFDRENEALQIYDAFFGERTHSPFIAITGVTGSGKTALAQTAASRYGWRFPDGIGYFRPGAEPVSEGVARALGWELARAPEAALATQVSQRLSASRCLLVLDNLESASDGALRDLRALLASWDTSVGGRAILVSQDHPKEFAELVGPNRITVGSLPVTACRDLVTSMLGGRERAERILGDEMAVAAELCFNHPRTLVSAGSALDIGQPWSTLKEDLRRHRVRGPAGINSEVLGQIIGKLEKKLPLTADFLDAWAVFEDRCRESTWRGLVRAAGAGDAALAQCSEVLNGLQGAEIIGRYDHAGEVHCVMHPLVVAHLRSRHDGLSDEKVRSLAGRHLALQASLAAEPADHPGDELGNVRRTLRLAGELGMWKEITAYCTAVAGDAGLPLVRRGPWLVAKELLDLGESAAAMIPDGASARLGFLLVRGLVRYRLAEFDQAAADYRLAGEAARALGRRHDELTALRGMGQVLYRCGDLDGSETAYRTGRELAEADSAGAVRDLADIDHQLGKVLYRRGDLTGARRLFERVRTVREANGEERNRAKTLHELARIEHADGIMDAAEELYLEALAIERAVGDPVTEQATLFQLAKLALERRDVPAAERLFRESRHISEGLNDLVWIAHAQYGQAMLAAARGAPDEAAERAAAAADLARRLNIGLTKEIAGWAAAAGVPLPAAVDGRDDRKIP
ncbi:tetratricopeptide repeat protein [Actinomadura violacea]|uniref:Tetratricopeptide repeat protein n=1 Tax=Actinomadura violacea TaxID=2819934 RepID=A0ABS3RKX4_9ACTN|nr:tetratricopeptide repeat protein [Actinomadura violacea]MBO2457377.1 tetratricopeptide repeat protein [Actinomadura violacea]